jgi:hypothetical protein
LPQRVSRTAASAPAREARCGFFTPNVTLREPA